MFLWFHGHVIAQLSASCRFAFCLRRTSPMAVLLIAYSVVAVSATEPITPSDGSSTSAMPTVPEGFIIEVVAKPPHVSHPTMACFDDTGRLFVAESGGENLKRKALEEKLPGSIRILEDTNGDGHYDKSMVFADELTLPQGVLWHNGAIYAASPPFIWRLEDTDGDGVADRRDQLVGQFGYTGNAASIHGCFLGPAGRIYWCDGRHGYKLQDKDGGVTEQGKAARIFSCKPDGSDVRVHCGGGMDNPVEVDFTSEGEMLGTVNLMYSQRGDCLVHWMHGGVYPKFNLEKYTDEFPKTGDFLPEVHNFGHVGVSGVTRYRSGGFGDDFRDNWFAVHFNSHRVDRVQLDRVGSTFQAQVEKFLVSENTYFHPTDILEDADGSLLVVDTGGWFLLGCPTSQVAHPERLGTIYRIRRTDAARPDDPWGNAINWANASPEDLIKLLADSRFVVQKRALGELVTRGEEAIPALTETVLNNARKEDEVTRRAVWALARIGSPSAQKILRQALSEVSESVRNAAVYACGINRDRAAVEKLCQLVESDSLPIRRQAATALGQIGDAAAIPSLLAALRTDLDRVLEHALIYALIEIEAPQELTHALSDVSPQVRRSALIALDQMPGYPILREQVLPLLHSDDFELSSAALRVVTKHPDWASDVDEILNDLLTRPLDEEGRSLFAGAIIAFSDNDKIRHRVVGVLVSNAFDPATKRLVLESIGRTGLKSLPTTWSKAVAQCLVDKDDSVVRQAVAILGVEGNDRLREPLLLLARDTTRPTDIRVQAMSVLPMRCPLEDALLALLTVQLRNGEPIQRLTAARAIGKAKLTRPQLLRVLELIAEVGPLELAPLLASFEEVNDTQLGEKLLQSLMASPGRSNVGANQISLLFKSFSPEVQQAAAALISKLHPNREAQAKRIAKLEHRATKGQAKLGKKVFFSRRTSCYVCHRIGNEGGLVGPDLTQVGQRRSSRDLAEAILYPSVSIVRGFESMTVVTDSGKAHTGMIVRQSSDAIHMRTSDQQELRILRQEIEEMVPSDTSIMPNGLDQSMTENELADLLAYLQTLR